LGATLPAFIMAITAARSALAPALPLAVASPRFDSGWSGSFAESAGTGAACPLLSDPDLSAACTADCARSAAKRELASRSRRSAGTGDPGAVDGAGMVAGLASVVSIMQVPGVWRTVESGRT
jgi:hypothetical protein